MRVITEQLFAQAAWVKAGGVVISPSQGTRCRQEAPACPPRGTRMAPACGEGTAEKAVGSEELPLLRVGGEEKHPRVYPGPSGRFARALEMLCERVQYRIVRAAVLCPCLPLPLQSSSPLACHLTATYRFQQFYLLKSKEKERRSKGIASARCHRGCLCPRPLHRPPGAWASIPHPARRSAPGLWVLSPY